MGANLANRETSDSYLDEILRDVNTIIDKISKEKDTETVKKQALCQIAVLENAIHFRKEDGRTYEALGKLCTLAEDYDQANKWFKDAEERGIQVFYITEKPAVVFKREIKMDEPKDKGDGIPPQLNLRDSIPGLGKKIDENREGVKIKCPSDVKDSREDVLEVSEDQISHAKVSKEDKKSAITIGEPRRRSRAWAYVTAAAVIVAAWNWEGIYTWFNPSYGNNIPAATAPIVPDKYVVDAAIMPDPFEAEPEASIDPLEEIIEAEPIVPEPAPTPYGESTEETSSDAIGAAKPETNIAETVEEKPTTNYAAKVEETSDEVVEEPDVGAMGKVIYHDIRILEDDMLEYEIMLDSEPDTTFKFTIKSDDYFQPKAGMDMSLKKGEEIEDNVFKAEYGSAVVEAADIELPED